MNNTEKQFLELLSKSIRNDNNVEFYDDVNWSNLINLAGEHKVEGIIYPLVSEKVANLNIDKNILEELKTFSFYTAISEARKISYLEKIIKNLQENNVKFIALNELILRSLYPQPEQRSMANIDLLIKKQDLGKVTDILKSIEYEVEDEDNNSIKFTHRLYPIIVIHWTLLNGKELGDSIWNNVIKYNILDNDIITLGCEDFLLYLCNSILDDISKKGLILRQIADIVLFTEANREYIDWNKFKGQASRLGIEKFILIIFSLCNILFKMTLPEVLLDRDIMYNPNIDILIEDLFIGVIYGINGDKNIIVNTKKEDYGFIENIKNFIRSKKIDKNRDKIIRWLGIQV